MGGAAQGGRRRGRAQRVIDLEEVCRRYNISAEEFLAWERAIERHGVPGLRVTRLQIYRDTDADAPKSRRRKDPENGRNPLR